MGCSFCQGFYLTERAAATEIPESQDYSAEQTDSTLDTVCDDARSLPIVGGVPVSPNAGSGAVIEVRVLAERELPRSGTTGLVTRRALAIERNGCPALG